MGVFAAVFEKLTGRKRQRESNYADLVQSVADGFDDVEKIEKALILHGKSLDALREDVEAFTARRDLVQRWQSRPVLMAKISEVDRDISENVTKRDAEIAAAKELIAAKYNKVLAPLNSQRDQLCVAFSETDVENKLRDTAPTRRHQAVADAKSQRIAAAAAVEELRKSLELSGAYQSVIDSAGENAGELERGRRLKQRFDQNAAALDVAEEELRTAENELRIAMDALLEI